MMCEKIMEGKGGENNFYLCEASECIGAGQEVLLSEA